MPHGETLQVPLDRPAAKAPFRLVLPWDLAGDQPTAAAGLTKALTAGERHVTLRGVTSRACDQFERGSPMAATFEREERSSRPAPVQGWWWRQVVESLPQLIWSTTPDGRCEYLSRPWADYTGVPLTDLCGLPWQTLVHPADRDGLHQPARRGGLLFPPAGDGVEGGFGPASPPPVPRGCMAVSGIRHTDNLPACSAGIVS